MSIFFELHSEIPREGPGDNESTRKAYKMLKDLPDNPKILDIGCGPGMQSLEIARQTEGEVLAVDMNEPFLKTLNKNAKEEGLEHKVRAEKMDMFNLDVEDESQDLIWSEGAIFIIGFEEGIKQWKNKLRKDGYMVVSEVSWLKDDVSKESKEFWNEGYPDMKNVEGNIKTLRNAGMEYIDHFTIPESAWWEDYYNPLSKRVDKMRIKYHEDKDVNNMLDGTVKEMELYKNHSEDYGYVFYIMQKK